MDRNNAFQSVDGAHEEQIPDDQKKSLGGLHTPALNDANGDRV
jgi:hypothetical protein